MCALYSISNDINIDNVNIQVALKTGGEKWWGGIIYYNTQEIKFFMPWAYCKKPLCFIPVYSANQLNWWINNECFL